MLKSKSFMAQDGIYAKRKPLTSLKNNNIKDDKYSKETFRKNYSRDINIVLMVLLSFAVVMGILLLN